VLKSLDEAAVLDQETGLVWARDAAPQSEPWAGAIEWCAFAAIGGRSGWRLPQVHELRSLVSSSTATLPEGHPFLSPPASYWTATTTATFPTYAYTVATDGTVLIASEKGESYRIWCVRGPGEAAQP
jgi:hypothetical protein